MQNAACNTIINKPLERSVLYPAVHILVHKANQLLLLKRKNTGCYDGFWCMPSGRIEPQESPSCAAKRELEEETGLITTPILVSTVLAKIPDFYQQGKADFEDLSFFFDVQEPSGEPINCEPDKHDEMRWFAIDELPEKLLPIEKIGLQAYSNKQSYLEFGY